MDHCRKFSAGDSHHSSGNGRPLEKTFLQRIQSCTAEEEEPDVIDTAADPPTQTLRPDFIVNATATDVNSPPQGPRRIYKSRLHRSVTIDPEDSKADDVNVAYSNSPSPNLPIAAQFRARGIPQRTRWTSRIARMKSLQRSRTIDTRGNTIQWNPCSMLVSPEINNKAKEAKLSEFHHLQDPRENLRSWSTNEADPYGSTFDSQSFSKKAHLDAGTQYYPPDLSIDADQVSPIEKSKKSKVSISIPDGGHRATQTNEIGPDTSEPAEGRIPPNAAAMADGHVEELCDPNKQSTSSYLKEQFFAFFQPSDNKLAMKLFGSKSALNKEKRRQQQHGKWIIHPCSSFR